METIILLNIASIEGNKHQLCRTKAKNLIQTEI